MNFKIRYEADSGEQQGERHQNFLPIVKWANAKVAQTLGYKQGSTNNGVQTR